MWSRVRTGGILGIESYPIAVEVDLTNGTQAFDIVGLPETVVRESRVRVKSALRNSGFQVPNRRTTVNLAPADIRKTGSVFDLPMAIGVMAASRQVQTASIAQSMLVGELSLDGSLRPIRGILPLALLAQDLGVDSLVVPFENAAEAGAVGGIKVLGARSLGEVVAHFRAEKALVPLDPTERPQARQRSSVTDMADVCGQGEAKRAATIAAAGGHNLLLTGSPGCGKSMIARRINTILPELAAAETLESSLVHSVAGLLANGEGLLTDPPFRAPHHTASPVAIIGGGNPIRPGEVSLAHHGVLFLDELPEFERTTIEALRQPLEDGVVVIARAGVRAAFPTQVMLVAAMNPCPCGWFGHDIRECTCSFESIRRYAARVSGPLLDRIDVHMEVPPARYEDLVGNEERLGSEKMRADVLVARRMQMSRNQGKPIWNASLDGAALRKHSALDRTCEGFLRHFVNQQGMSARAYTRVLRVARTIADLDGAQAVGEEHLVEALSYRAASERLVD